MSAKLLNLNIGEIIAVDEPAVISTILGSCVSVCLYSERRKAGGMVHFSLPKRPFGSPEAQPFKYGDAAIGELITRMMKLTGEAASSLTAKVVGGCAGTNGSKDIGAANSDLAFAMLKESRIRVAGQDVGGRHGRKVLFHPHSGRLQVADLAVAAEISTPESKKTSPKAITKPKVLIVDDSATIRKLLTNIFTRSGDFEILAAVANPIEAEQVLRTQKPDVITLDVHMPEMDGITFLESLMPRNPIPTVMITSLSLEDGGQVLRALELGAVDYIQKPTLDQLKDLTSVICEKVKSAAAAKVRVRHARPALRALSSSPLSKESVLAIGASTGGTEAIKEVLLRLPEHIPPTVIVQHIPPVFSRAFAGRLNDLCPFQVKEAEDGDRLRPDLVLIAPGGQQMEVDRDTAGHLKIRLTDAPPRNRHKPSVDVLFDSVAKHAGQRTIGIILTGMGNDGAQGLLGLRQAGARTLAQDEASSVVYGMPKAAAALGAAEKIAPLEQVADVVVEWLKKRPGQN